MPRRKVVSGVGALKRGLTGAQTTERRLSQQFGLRGGLNNNSDISAQSPSEWLNCTNAKMPIVGSNTLGAIVGTPLPKSMFSSGSYTLSGGTINYLMQPTFFSVAALQNTGFPA
jgi:hypothetical protein